MSSSIQLIFHPVTSSVTYCEPPESLLIQQFDIAYFVKNESVSFNISAASVQANVNVTANLLLNVYGIRAVNITLDLCSIFGGALCPLPMYNFTGSDNLSLPKSLGVQGKIPNIAFTVPDLEGVAQLVLTEVGTGTVKACVQATLSNGWSTHQTSVEWTIGGITLAAWLLAIWQSLSPDAILPFRFMDLLFLYQTVASSSLLSLNYPSTYRAFTLNFAWALGMFASSPTSAFQPSIDRMRHLTGGNLANSTSASAVGLVNRRLSPYNFFASMNEVPSLSKKNIIPFSARSLPSSLLSYPSSTLLSETAFDVQTVTTSSSNVLQAGIPIFVNTLHIATANAFMTVFLCSLILIACVLAVFMVISIALLLFGQLKGHNPQRQLKSIYLSFAQAWWIRLILFLSLPIPVFSFYQWTLKDSWLSTLLSVVAILALFIALSYPSISLLRFARREGKEALYRKTSPTVSKGPLYAQYLASRIYFYAVPQTVTLLKAALIAFVSNNGEAQILLMVILDGLTLMSYLVLRPCSTRGGNVFSAFMCLIRLLCNALMIAFVERLNVAPIPRTVIGLVLVAIFSLTIITTYIILLVNIGQSFKTINSGQSSIDISIVEKANVEEGKTALPRLLSSTQITRPPNPTPDGSDHPSSHLLQPFLVSPTETEVTSSVCTSKRTSETMTVGSLLPRRWSFSPLHSPTGSSQIHEVPTTPQVAP
ncbi:hypothetical protein H0H93_008623 [Arthromyces matolae]|nr:hypothetical protein H0H93_008623 [Arthromyces matolae]